MSKGRVIQLVLGDVRRDARVLKSGQALKSAGYDVIFVGEERDARINKPRFFKDENIEGCPCYMNNDGRRLYDSLINQLNRLNPLYDPRDKIKTSIRRAVKNQGDPITDRIRALSLVPAYAVCLAGRPLALDAYWDKMQGHKTRGLRIMEELLKLQPEIIHAHDLPTFALIAPYCREHGIKLIYDSHELERGRNAPRWSVERKRAYAQLEADHIKAADAVITVSRSIGKILMEAYEIAEPIIIPNCPPKANIRPNQPLKNRLGLEEDHKVMLYLGSIQPGRGIDLLIEVLRKLPKEVHLAFIGYPIRTYEEDFKDLIESADDLDERIHVLGRQPYADLIYEAYGADLGYNAIALTCESYENALPNKFFEYVFANIPVVSTHQADVVSLTKEYELGRIVADRDLEDLAKTINSMLLEDQKSLSPEKRDEFVEEYCWENQNQKLIQLYEQLL